MEYFVNSYICREIIPEEIKKNWELGYRVGLGRSNTITSTHCIEEGHKKRKRDRLKLSAKNKNILLHVNDKKYLLFFISRHEIYLKLT